MSDQVGEAYIDIHADDSGLPAEVKKATARAARGAKIEVDAELAKSASPELKAAAAKAATRAAATVRFDAQLDEKRLNAAADLAAARARTDVTFNADADFSTLAAEAKAAAAAARTRVEIEAHLDTKGFRRDADGLFRGLDGQGASIGDLTDALGDFGQAAEEAATQATNLGSSGGRAGRSLATRFVPIIGAIAAAILVALPYIVALGGGLIALAGQLTYAAAGGGLALVGILGSLAAAGGTVLIAMQGLPEAFKLSGKAAQEMAEKGKVSEATAKKLAVALDQLAPAARKFMDAIQDIGDAFGEFQRKVQQKLFAGLDDDIRRLATGLLPDLQRGFGRVAGAVNGAAERLLDFVNSGKGSKQIGDILAGLGDTFAEFAASIGEWGPGLLTLLQESAPYAQRLAQAFGALGERFTDFITKAAKDGSFEKFMDSAFAAGGRLMRVFGSVGKLLLTLFGGSENLGAGLLTSLNDIITKFDEWLKTPEGQQGMADFFADVGENLRGIREALSPENIASLVTTMQQLADIINKVSGFLDKMDGGKFGEIARQATEFLGPLALISPVLAGIVAGIRQLVTGLQGVDWGGVGQSIMGALGQAGAFLSGLWTDITTGVTGAASQIGGFFSGLASTVGGFLASIPGKIADLAGQIGAGIAEWWDGVTTSTSELIGRIVGFFAGLPAKIITAAGNLGAAFTEWLSGLPAAATEAVVSLIEVWADLSGKSITAMGDIVGKFTQWLADLPNRALNAAADVIVAFIGLADKIIEGAGDLANTIGEWAMAVPGILQTVVLTAVAAFIGLAGKLIAAAGDLLVEFGTWVSGLPAAAVQLGVELALALGGLANRMIAAAGDLLAAFGTWVSGLPGRAAALLAALGTSLAGLAGRMIAAAGNLLSAFGTWVSGLPGRAAELAAELIGKFNGLAGKLFTAAGNLANAFASWAAGLGAAGGAAAQRIIDAFKGLAAKIVEAIGTIIPKIAMPDIGGIVGRIRTAVQNAAEPNARGSIVTSPTFALVGEAGPEVIVPLGKGPMDPGVEALLASIANKRGLGDGGDDGAATVAGGGILRDMIFQLPSGDPEAVSMAVVNRLVAVRAV